MPRNNNTKKYRKARYDIADMALHWTLFKKLHDARSLSFGPGKNTKWRHFRLAPLQRGASYSVIHCSVSERFPTSHLRGAGVFSLTPCREQKVYGKLTTRLLQKTANANRTLLRNKRPPYRYWPVKPSARQSLASRHRHGTVSPPTRRRLSPARPARRRPSTRPLRAR